MSDRESPFGMNPVVEMLCVVIVLLYVMVMVLFTVLILANVFGWPFDPHIDPVPSSIPYQETK